MLKLLRRKSGSDTIAAIGLHPDGVSLICAQSKKDVPPKVTDWEYRPWQYGDPLESVLKDIVQAHKLKKKPCSTVIDPVDYRLLVSETVDVPQEEMAEAVRWKIKDLLDFDVMDATLDVFGFPGPQGTNESGQCYVVAAKNQSLKKRIKMLLAAGANVTVVDIPEMALRNVAATLDKEAKGIALLYFSPSVGFLTISKGDVLHMSRNLNVGLGELVESTDRSELTDRILVELRRSIDYYASHFKLQPVDRLLIAPLPAELVGWELNFSERLGIPVDVLDVNSLATWPDEVPREVAVKFFLTFGAALRQMQ